MITIISYWLDKYSGKKLAIMSSLCFLLSFLYTNYSYVVFNNSRSNWLQSSVSLVIDKISIPSIETENSFTWKLNIGSENKEPVKLEDDFTDISKVSLNQPELLNQEIEIKKSELKTINLPLFYNWTSSYSESKYIDLRLLLIMTSYLENKNLSKEEFDKELNVILNKNLNQPPESIYSLRYSAVNYRPDILMKTKIIESSEEEISSILNKGLPFIIYFNKENKLLRYIVKGETKTNYIVFNANGEIQEFDKEYLLNGKILLLYSDLYE